MGEPAGMVDTGTDFFARGVVFRSGRDAELECRSEKLRGQVLGIAVLSWDREDNLNVILQTLALGLIKQPVPFAAHTIPEGTELGLMLRHYPPH